MDGDGETFDDWIEQMELVAGVCHWSKQTKLVNLVTRLRSSAYGFYRSCTPHQRSNYQQLIAALSKRFTPVRIQSVQTSWFHEWKQNPMETVDHYAQDLKRLFCRAYTPAQRGSQEAESMTQSVLAYQFVAALQHDIKSKVAGCEGTFEELLTKARFQEARLRDVIQTGKSHQPAPTTKMTTGSRDSREQPRPPRSGPPFQKPDVKCFSCGGSGHFKRDCLLKGCSAPKEARGKGPLKSSALDMAMVRAELGTTLPETKPSDDLPDEIRAAVTHMMATIHGITPQRGHPGPGLDPRP